MPNDREHGDRQRFLAEARSRIADGIAVNRVHPPPPVPAEGTPAPRPQLSTVDATDGVAPSRDDLVASFVRTLEDAGATCHVVDGEIPEILLDNLVSEFDAWKAVVSGEPEAQALGERLTGRGVEVTEATPEAAAQARLGITSASAGIAATGSIVLDSSRTGGRVGSVLPPVHICVLPADRLVASPSDVLRPLGEDPAAMPPSLVLVTGPSRSGDIEQILTVGAHGPAELHVILIR